MWWSFRLWSTSVEAPLRCVAPLKHRRPKAFWQSRSKSLVSPGVAERRSGLGSLVPRPDHWGPWLPEDRRAWSEEHQREGRSAVLNSQLLLAHGLESCEGPFVAEKLRSRSCKDSLVSSFTYSNNSAMWLTLAVTWMKLGMCFVSPEPAPRPPGAAFKYIGILSLATAKVCRNKLHNWVINYTASRTNLGRRS